MRGSVLCFVSSLRFVVNESGSSSYYVLFLLFFFFNDTATTEIYTLPYTTLFRSHAEGDRIKAGAQAEVEQEVNRAKEALRSQVASLAVAGAAQILERTVDENAHKELLDKLASEL